jgi:hypothetical protein
MAMAGLREAGESYHLESVSLAENLYKGNRLSFDGKTITLQLTSFGDLGRLGRILARESSA